jgi:hypothetical protein
VLQGEYLECRPLCDCLPVCDQKVTPDGRWVYARDLRIDDVVRSHSFGTQKISALELSQTQTLVYNFLVNDLHNYAVGENEILVHNTNSPGKISSNTPRPRKVTKEGMSNPAKKNDIPSWAEGERPYVGENGKAFAKRLLDEKYGTGNWKKGPGTEYNKIRKWGDSAFREP